MVDTLWMVPLRVRYYPFAVLVRYEVHARLVGKYWGIHGSPSPKRCSYSVLKPPACTATGAAP